MQEKEKKEEEKEEEKKEVKKEEERVDDLTVSSSEVQAYSNTASRSRLTDLQNLLLVLLAMGQVV